MANKYIMFDMSDERIKHLSEVLGNDTCKKILEFLTEKESSESEIANELKIPLNTVGYNIKKLLNAGLIESSSHLWSVKGKKIPVYKVSDKKILISPKKKSFDNLKPLISAFLITGLGALLIRAIEKPRYGENKVIDYSLKSAETLAESSGSSLNAGNSFLNYISTLSPWTWFLIGAWFAIILFLLLNLKRKSK